MGDEPSAAGGAPRRRRADAERNRAAIVESARERFARFGVDTSLEGVAALAGVGPGTLYRHFPTREALLEEVLRARTEELVALRAELGGQADPSDALRRWLRALETYVGLYDGLPEPLRTAVEGGDSPLALSCGWIVSATGELLASAQRVGTARAGVRGRDLVLTALALAWVAGSSAADGESAEALRGVVEIGYTAPTAR